MLCVSRIRSSVHDVVTLHLFNSRGPDMLVTKIEDVYEVTLPADVRQFLSYLSFGVSLGLTDTTSVLTCLGFGSYLSRLILWMLVPPVLIGAILLGCIVRLVCKCSLSCAALVDSALPLIVRLLFLLYPLIANVAFEAFSCYPPLDDTKFLIADVSIQCDLETEEYVTISATAWCAIGVYAFGLLALNAALLFRAREAIRKQKPTPLSSAIRFLYREYEPWAYWWELVSPPRANVGPSKAALRHPCSTCAQMEMLRRLVLVGVFVLMGERGSIMQIVIGTAFCAIYMLIQMQAGPHAETSDDYLANGCSFALLIFFLCCIIFKVRTLTSL